MAVTLRMGDAGEYYGNDTNSSNTLTTAQMQVNAKYIYFVLLIKGWTPNAIAGILGNMQHESAINPGRWQSDRVGNTSGGYGLVQWTPATKYIEWAEDNGYTDYSTMDGNLARLLYEVENNIQYIATSGYNYSFTEFTKSTKTPYELACAFAWNYERSAVVLYGSEEEKEALRQKRGNSATYWFQYLTGENPPDPGDPDEPDTPGGVTSKRKKFKFILFGRNRRIV